MKAMFFYLPRLNRTQRTRILLHALALPWCATLGCASGAAPSRAEHAVHASESPSALLAAGRRAMAHGDDVRAEHYFTLAMRDESTGREALLMLMETCIRGARYSAALGHAKRYLHHHGEDVDLRYLVATLHEALGQPHLARRELTRVLTVAPSHGEAHYLAAHIFHREGQEPMRARFHGERYLEVAPDGAHALEVAGMLEELTEQIDADVTLPVTERSL